MSRLTKPLLVLATAIGLSLTGCASSGSPQPSSAPSSSSAPASVGESEYTSAKELGEAFAKAGVQCEDYRAAEPRERYDLGMCTNENFQILTFAVYSDMSQYEAMLENARQRTPGEVTVATTIYGKNWMTISSANTPQDVEAAAKKLGARLTAKQ